MSVERAISIIRFRRDGIAAFIDAEASHTTSEQLHLDADRPEKAYWLHGYQMALADVLELLSQRPPESSGNKDTRSECPQAE
jgi:hypothetical protein